MGGAIFELLKSIDHQKPRIPHGSNRTSVHHTKNTKTSKQKQTNKQTKELNNPNHCSIELYLKSVLFDLPRPSTATQLRIA